MDDYDPLEKMVQEVAKFVNPPKEEFKITKAKIKPRRPPKSKPTGGIDPPNEKLPRKTKADKDAKKDAEGKTKEGWSKAAIAAGVIGVAAVGSIAANAAADMILCDNATMTITDVYPTGQKGSNASSNTSSTSFFGGLFTKLSSATAGLSPPPKTVDIKFTVNNDYKVNEGHDDVEISGTGTELDGTTKLILKLVDPNTIRVECQTNDCSNVYATTGTAEPQCSIADAINKGVKDTIQGPIDIAKDFLSGAANTFMTFVGPIVLIICAVLALFLIVPLLFRLFKPSAPAPAPKN